METGSFVGLDALRIFTRSWQPPMGQARAVVVIVHGFNAHSGYYLWVGEELASNGLAVYALDLRGRGQSDGDRFHVDKAEDYVADVATFVKMAKASHPELPVFLLGHSAGGVVACLYTLDHQDEITGLISESLAYELPAPDFALAVLKGLSYVLPNAHVLKLNNADFSRDPRVVDAMNNDPLIAKEAQPTETVAALVRADERLEREFGEITLPVLILHGTLDKVAKPSGSQHFYEMVGSSDKTLRLYDGYYHDLLNDIDKEVVMADIQQWIDAHIPVSSLAEHMNAHEPNTTLQA